MKKRKLGASGLELAPLALGGNVFGWTVDEPTSFKLLDAFLAAGFNFVDTADVYSRFAPGNRGGESETILGDWIRERGNRDSVLIATKVGMEMRAGKKGLSRKYISGALDDSLRRLQTDYIDLYQAHTDDASTPLEETLAAFDDALREGKVRAIGASNYSAGRLAAALTTSREKGLSRFGKPPTPLQPLRPQ